MAKINRRYIDKHWLVFVIRGVLAAAFGFVTLFGFLNDLEFVISAVAVFLLFMGIVDSVSALYASVKKHGWFNSIIDALIDVATALCLLFFARTDFTASIVIIAVYTFISGVIDIFHGFLSTVDPTDRFIRILSGVVGCVAGFAILNSGELFVRFFGAYMMVVGITSLIYGVHNRSQNIEDKVARKEAAKKAAAKRVAAKKTTKKKK